MFVPPASLPHIASVVSVGALLLFVGNPTARAEDDASPTPSAAPEATAEPERPPADYAGRAADAEWRKAAAERIEKFRKADLTVLVTDSEGKPIKEAEVGAKLKRHAFRFGTVVSVEFAQEPPDEEETPKAPNAEMPAGPKFGREARAIYREKLFGLFNTATPQEASAAIDGQMASWLRSRGFLSDAEPVEVTDVPSRFAPDSLVPPEALWTELEGLAEAGLPLAARRYALPVNVDDPAQLQLQADYTRDFFTVLFSHPKVREISIAGFWEPASGVPGWALFDGEWTMRPVGKIYSDLVTKLWTTDETALTDAAGKVRIRGFVGRYRISVSAGSKTRTITAELPPEGAEVAIRIE